MDTPSTFPLFDDNWLYPIVEDRTIIWRFSEVASQHFITQHFTKDSLRSNFNNAVKKFGSHLGSKPFVALSGGIDSQATCLALKQNHIDFTAAILIFKNHLNKHDVESALYFCAINKIKYVTWEIDVMSFLARKRPTYVEKYSCPSPQFTTHFHFYEHLISEGATSIVCGGNPPSLHGHKWEFVSSRSQTAWMTFSQVNNFPLFGNFLAWSKDIALPFMLNQPNRFTEDSKEWYKCKVEGMKLSGLSVIPQAQKFNGFEIIKKQLEEKSGDGWAFEKAYRLPSHSKYPEFSSWLKLDDNVALRLTQLNNEFALINKYRSTT